MNRYCIYMAAWKNDTSGLKDHIGLTKGIALMIPVALVAIAFGILKACV